VSIHLGKCPTFGGFLANCVGKMAPCSSLDCGTSVDGYSINQFIFPLIPMDVNSSTTTTRGDLECISIHFEVTHMFGG
jgi:hypothetical protein